MANTVSRIISDETLSCIIQIESAGKPTAKARTSSATGLGQFIDATWMSVVSRHRPDLLKGRSKAQVLALRKDPVIAIEVLARFTEDNARALGSGYSNGDPYLAHFASVGTAKRLLNASRDAPVSSIMSPAAIHANPGILKDKTAGQIRVWAERKMKAAQGKNWIAKLYRGASVIPETRLNETAAADPEVAPRTGKAEGVSNAFKVVLLIVVLTIVIAMALLKIG